MAPAARWRLRAALACGVGGAVVAIAAHALRRRRKRLDDIEARKAFEASFRQGPAWAHLRVAPSSVPNAGDGLFVTRSFAQGAVLGHYRGRVLSLARAMKLTDRDYLMGGFGINAHVDAREAYAMPGRYVNDTFDTAALNAEFVKCKKAKSAALVATRALSAGEEVFAAYGPSYWRARGVDPVTGAQLKATPVGWRRLLAR